MTLASAESEVATIAQQLAMQHPERNRNLTTWLVTLQQETVGDITPTVILLAAAVALLSLIVCANVGNMLLARLAERMRELTLRGALGASRARLFQQLLTESMVLGVSGALVAVVLAYWMTRALAMSGPATIPRVSEVTLDGTALVVAVTASILMSACFGLIPALRIARSLSGNPLTQRTGSTAEVGRLRELLMIAEFALAFGVLVGAGLVFMSSRALEATSPGYDPDHVLTFRLSLPQAQYLGAERRTAFFSALLNRLRELPGVHSAGAVNVVPQMDSNPTVAFDLDGAASAASVERPTARFRIATPGYFESLGIGVIQGRGFQQADVASGAIVVSRSMAKRFWPGTNPVGRSLRLTTPANATSALPIVGVVEDVRQWINTAAEPTLYWLNMQQPDFVIALRTTVEPASFNNAVRQAVHQIDPEQPVFDVLSMAERLDQSQQLTYERFRTAVMAGFAIAAFTLAAMGIYGVIRYSVVQRTQEFGVRMALGASSQQVFTIVLLQSLRTITIGGAIGLVGSIAVGRALGGVLYGSRGSDPLIIAGVAILLAAVATIAALGPARRAASTDPMRACRSE